MMIDWPILLAEQTRCDWHVGRLRRNDSSPMLASGRHFAVHFPQVSHVVPYSQPDYLAGHDDWAIEFPVPMTSRWRSTGQGQVDGFTEAWLVAASWGILVSYLTTSTIAS